MLSFTFRLIWDKLQVQGSLCIDALCWVLSVIFKWCLHLHLHLCVIRHFTSLYQKNVFALTLLTKHQGWYVIHYSKYALVKENAFTFDSLHLQMQSK